MRTQAVLAILLILTGAGFYAAYAFYTPTTAPQDATIETVETQDAAGNTDNMTVIRYSWNGTAYQTPFVTDLRPALDYIRDNTADTTVAAWWDYGHSIRGYTGRNVIAATPSEWAFEHTVVDTSWDVDERGTFANRKTVQDLADIFVSSPATAEQLVQDYNASYLVLTRDDIGMYAAISQVSTADVTNFTALQALNCIRSGDTCHTQQHDNTTFLQYSAAGESNYWVPVTVRNGSYTMNGTPVYQRGERTVRARRCADTTNMTAGMPGCVAFNPFTGAATLVYVPDRATHALFTRLLFSPQNVERWQQVYGDVYAQVWRYTGE